MNTDEQNTKLIAVAKAQKEDRKMTDYFEKLVRANFRYGRMRSCCCPLTNAKVACAASNFNLHAITGAIYVKREQTSL